MDAEIPDSPAPAPAPDPVAAQRRRVFESLPAEIQANPKIRREFGIDPPLPVTRVGLGDVVERLARPFARVLGVEDCSGCKKRKERLNRVRLWPGSKT